MNLFLYLPLLRFQKDRHTGGSSEEGTGDVGTHPNRGEGLVDVKTALAGTSLKCRHLLNVLFSLSPFSARNWSKVWHSEAPVPIK